MGVKNIVHLGDLILVVLQIRKHYTMKHPRMRSFRNVVGDIIENYFDVFNITVVHREDNQHEDH